MVYRKSVPYNRSSDLFHPNLPTAPLTHPPCEEKSFSCQ
jgi:hypothetical protein